MVFIYSHEQLVDGERISNPKNDLFVMRKTEDRQVEVSPVRVRTESPFQYLSPTKTVLIIVDRRILPNLMHRHHHHHRHHRSSSSLPPLRSIIHHRRLLLSVSFITINRISYSTER